MYTNEGGREIIIIDIRENISSKRIIYKEAALFLACFYKCSW